MKNKRVVAYIFYSVSNTPFVEEYKKMIIEYAKDNLDTNETDIDFFIDIGKRENRTAIICMMDKIKNKEYDILLLIHINTLFKVRNAEDYENIKKLNEIVDTILENGVKIISIKENKELEP